jgi:alpha-L-fucosidase 2
VSAKLVGGIVSDVKISSEKGRSCQIINPWQDKKVQLIKNGKTTAVLSGDTLVFETVPNELIELKPL